MGVRDKGYKYYGITDDEAKKLEAWCRVRNIDDDKLLLECAYEIKPELALDIFYSLTTNISYDKLCSKKYIPINRFDFYGYRRATLARLKEKIRS